MDFLSEGKAKIYSKRSNIVKTADLIESRKSIVIPDPSISMTALSEQFKVAKSTVSKFDIIIRRLKKLKCLKEPGMLWFFFEHC